jgi:tagatose 1,6-diphosphate aldolase
MISEQKAARLRALSTRDGIIAALAMDQRNSLRVPLAHAASKSPEQISGAQLAEFKSAVTAILSPHASAVLLDPEYGVEAFFHRAPGCGLLMTYEMDGFDNPRPHRMLALMQEYSVRRLRDLGAHGVKILLSWSPFDDESANDQKRALIERIGAECRGLDMPLFLEPVGYDPGGLDPKSLEYARIKPDIVIRSMKEFSKDIYNVDVLKVEFPVSPGFLGAAYTREQALEYFRQADAVVKRP